MIQENDSIVLKRDFPDLKLKAGDMGTVVSTDDEGNYMVEFVLPDGESFALEAFISNDIRKRKSNELISVRQVTVQ